jgi:hypothetical protein
MDRRKRSKAKPTEPPQGLLLFYDVALVHEPGTQRARPLMRRMVFRHLSAVLVMTKAIPSPAPYRMGCVPFPCSTLSKASSVYTSLPARPSLPCSWPKLFISVRAAKHTASPSGRGPTTLTF